MKASLVIALGLALGAATAGRVLAHEDLLARISLLTAQISTNRDNVEALIQRGDTYRLHGSLKLSLIHI